MYLDDRITAYPKLGGTPKEHQVQLLIHPVSFWGQLILDVDVRKKYCKSSCIKMFELGVVYYKQSRSSFAK